MSTTGVEGVSIRPVTVAPSSMVGGGSVSPTRTSKVRVTGSACGDTSRTRPCAMTFGSPVRVTRISASADAARRTWAGDVEHRVAPLFARKRRDHLSRLHDGSGARSDCGHDARRVRLELGEAHEIVRRLELRLRGVDLGLRGVHGLARLIVVGAGRPALPQQRVLAFESVGRLGQRRLRRGQRGLGGAQRVLLVLRLEAGDDLPGLDPVALP